MNHPIIHLTIKKPNNQNWNTTKLYDPLLLKSLESFRELTISEFYREHVGQSNDCTLVVKVKMEDGNYQTLNDELDWELIVRIVKNGQTLQFQVKCKPSKKVHKKQLREIQQRLKELEQEVQLLHLKKKLIELNFVKSEEKPQDPRDKLLESIRIGKELKETPTTTKITICPREILLNSIKDHHFNNSEQN